MLSRRPAPAVLLHRLSGPLNALLACGVARRVAEDVIELRPNEQEAREGGMIAISMTVPVFCPACTGRRSGADHRAEATEAARTPAPQPHADTSNRCRRCQGRRTVDELFSAWLALPPNVADGAVLVPSALLPGMVRPVEFRVRRLTEWRGNS